MPRTRYEGGVPIEAKQLCRMATGQYTGDGTISQAITGIGFRPKLVWINIDPESASLTNPWVGFKHDQLTGTYAIYWENADASRYHQVNRVISLDADGFTVDDWATDGHPNKSDQLYDFVAFG